MYKIGVITAYPKEDWQSARLISVFGKLAEVVVLDPASMVGLVLDGAPELRWGEEDAASFDAFVLARGLSPRGDADLQFALYHTLDQCGALVVNRIGPLLDAQDKFRTSALLARARVQTPRSAVVQTPADAAEAVRCFGSAVLKPVWGSLGDGVERVDAGLSGERRARHRVEREGTLFIQEYVPQGGRDYRAFVVGRRVVAAMERRAPAGEFRTNVVRGSSVRRVALSRAAQSLARRASVALGLDYSGVDLAEGPRGPTVLEVNGNPSWLGLYEVTRRDVAHDIAGYVLKSIGGRRRARGEGWKAGLVQGRRSGNPTVEFGPPEEARNG